MEQVEAMTRWQAKRILKVGEAFCTRCRQIKSIDAFLVDKRGKPGYYCKECKREYERGWHKNEKQYHWRLRQRAAVLIAYGARCAACGENNLVVLQLDHVDEATAAEDRRLTQNTVYRRALLAPEGKYQLLCANCNIRKKYGRKAYEDLANCYRDLKADIQAGRAKMKLKCIAKPHGVFFVDVEA